ncbi:DUF554 domain-containing protein [Nocardioides marmoriginsengisoli]|uniref:DUF554 domain-containing protein n=1 Tax=Nocardioides marmoriginsengisoli TaxID=661483 RepID=A0A3N0CNL0_9ACTN|nr:DUF554 domain-containing protein [Nocardioides marmoriginsengisoli]RNL64940.1 DUF554 domain-containing protein [Nocardioides marmoriginsengisoli]
MFIGTGTVVNATTVLVGSGLGVLIGHRLPLRTRSVVTDALGLVTLLIAASSAFAVSDDAFSDAVGGSAPMLIVLGALLIGAIIGSLARIEDRLEGLGDVLQRRLSRGGTEDHAGRDRFIQGFMTASLVFCVGPLTILGSITEGIGEGSDQLLLKSALDGFASIAFAAAFGWGVAASVLTLVLIQGSLTALGAALGDFLPEAHLAALTATGGLLLVGVALRLLEIKQLKVGDLLPALLIAPLLTELVIQLR